MNAKTFLFLAFHAIRTLFLNVPKNAEKYAKILFQNVSRSLVGGASQGTQVGEGVTERRVVLTRKRQKKRKIGEGEDKLLEK